MKTAKPQKKLFYVYFEQVDAQRYLVRATDDIDARIKAKRAWKQDNGTGYVRGVEDGEQ